MAEKSTDFLTPIVVGANHRSSTMALRDQLFVEDSMAPAFLSELKALDMTNAMVLSTCDRVEVHGLHASPDVAERVVRQSFAQHSGAPEEELREQFYLLYGDDALRHMFRVAASLESQVIGEPQVLGQVKAAHRIASDSGMIGSNLESILQACYSASKRVRTETPIGERPVSIASAAVQLAKDVQGDLSRSRGVLIGDGDMGELVATQLLNAGLGHLVALHHTPERANMVATRLSCHWADMGALANEMAEAEVVVTAIGKREHTLTGDMVRVAVTRRRRKPVFIIDLAIPGDVDPSVNRIDEAFLYDIGDLERIAMDGLSYRENAAEQAGQIVEQELAAYTRSRSERAAVPVLSKLRDHVRALRDDALRDSGGDAEKATHLLTTRLLHDPSVVMREIAAGAGRQEELKIVEDALERLFKLKQTSSHADWQGAKKQKTEDGE